MIGSLMQKLLPDPCSVTSTYLVVYGLCLVSEVIGAVFWVCEHWGRKESTDILCGWLRVWGQAQHGQFGFSPELELINGCFLPIPFFPSLPSFFQRRFPCLLMQHPSKPSWHPQPVWTQWYSPTITGQLCAWNSVSFGSVLSEAEAVLCVKSLEKTFCSLE